MADRIVVMNAGRVEQVGTPLELYDHPRNLFVATFIGSPSMNLLDGRLHVEDGRTVFRVDDTFDLALEGTPSNPAGEVVCGIRPEHLVLDPNGIAAEVVVLEPTGSETQVIMQLNGHVVTGLFRERIRALPGETIRIAVPAHSIHLFDKTTGDRL